MCPNVVCQTLASAGPYTYAQASHVVLESSIWINSVGAVKSVDAVKTVTSVGIAAEPTAAYGDECIDGFPARCLHSDVSRWNLSRQRKYHPIPSPPSRFASGNALIPNPVFSE